MDSLFRLNQDITGCRKCPRLVKHRESVGRVPPKRYYGQQYWARPLPGFGDPGAAIYIIGLAPAAHGGNRTGRIFTGDRSGDWLFSALYAHGLSNQETSVAKDDGLKLYHAYIGAAVRCAPPDNKPLLEEFENCRPYLMREWQLLQRVRVVVALGSIAYASVRHVLRGNPDLKKFRYPKFAHGLKVSLPDGRVVICSYHPSQQNTFTGKLTREMFLQIFADAKKAAGI
ncbi:MAG TPA: uracil-DNA glycosylase [Acidobacteriota bacterium]